MLSKIFPRVTLCARLNTLNKIFPKFYGLYEPDYLKLSEPKYPLYPPLLIRLRGYDFPILESYQAWIHKIAKAMKFNIMKSYAMPSKDFKIVKYKKDSTNMEVEYLLKIYERNLKINNVYSITLPIFIRVLEAGLPEGVELFIDKYTEQHNKDRYLVDEKFEELKSKYEAQLTK